MKRILSSGFVLLLVLAGCGKPGPAGGDDAAGSPSPGTSPTPTTTPDINPPPAPSKGDVIFVELMPDPATISDFDGEWFELKNVREDSFDINGCRLVDAGTNGDDHVIDDGADLIIEPGQVLVFAKTVVPADNGGIQNVAYGFGDMFSLTNTGDEAQLYCGNTLIDEVVYDPSWPFDIGYSMAVNPAAETDGRNDDVNFWCAGTLEYYPAEHGSPGEATSHCQ